jgi:putative membrane protein
MFDKITLAATILLTFNAFADPVGAVSNDGEIAKVLTTIDDGEIDAAKMELKHGKNPDARAFAQTMIKEHKSNMDETKALAKTNSLDPKDSDLSKSLKKDAKSNNGDLKRANKAEFDKAYLKEQIKMHQEALAVIDGKLTPKVDNPNLRQHLMKTRDAVAMHLDHAKELQSKL